MVISTPVARGFPRLPSLAVAPCSRSLLSVLLPGFGSTCPRMYKPPPPTSRIEVNVVRDTDSKPVENASR